MITLYHHPLSRAARMVWLLEELGQPYRLERVDIHNGDQLKPAYKAINPMLKVPAVRDGDTVVWESGAICVYLADKYPKAGLAPGVNEAQRGDYLKWMFFASSDIEPAFSLKDVKLDVPALALAWGSYERVLDAIVGVLKKGPFVLGDRFSAVDVMMGSAVQFGIMQKMIPEKPEFTRYLKSLSLRSAFQRANARNEKEMESVKQ